MGDARAAVRSSELSTQRLAQPPQTLSDERLAELSAKGIDSAFAMLVLRHRRGLVYHCAEIVGHADAEEVVQEALLRAYLALARGESVNHFGPWLRTIAHNAALNLLRARAIRPVVSHDYPGAVPIAPNAFERRETLRAVVRALEELPERQRQALVMRELEGRSYAEIETRLKTSNGAVRQLLNRARTAVRERLDAVAGLIPALRCFIGDGGGSATAARLGALSGGCAVTIKLCAATVLPAVLPPSAAAPKAGRADRHEARAPNRAARQAGPVAAWRTPSTRSASASQESAMAASSRQLSNPKLVAVGTGRSTSRSQPLARIWRDGSASGTALGARGLSGRAPSGSGSTPVHGGSAPGTSTPLQMGPNEPAGSASPGGSANASPGGSSGSSRPNSGGTAPPGSGMTGQPVPSPGRTGTPS